MALFLSDALSDEELKRLIQRAEKVRPLALEDLPLGELKRWLEQRFVTEAPNILLPRTVDTGQIADEAITATQITANTITANEIAAGTITATELSAGSVTTDKLAANAVTAEKIASHTITAAEIAAGTITATEIAAGTITATEIAADTITANEIAADAITTSELAANSVTSAKIAAGTIVGGDIAAGTIDTGNLVATAIDGMTITGALIRTAASGARVLLGTSGGTAGITAYDAADAVVLDFSTVTGNLQIKGEILTGSTVPAGTITDTIIGDQIALTTITGGHLVANTITANEIAADSIGTSELAADSVTATEINVATLDAISVDAGTITAGTFRGPIFETAASAPKTRMDTTGIFVEDSSSNTVLRIDESGGLNLLYATFSAEEFLRKITWEDGSGNSYGEIYTAYDSTGDDSYLYLLANDPVGVNSYGFQIMEQNGGFGRIQFGGGGTQYVLEDQGHSDFQWARGWQAQGTKTAIAAGSTVVIGGGSETFDTDLAGDSDSFTIPVAGIWRIDGYAELQNANADKRVILTYRKNGSNQNTLVSIFTNVAAQSCSAAGFIYASLAAGDVIDAVITNGDSAARNVAWRLAVTWHSD